MQNWVGVVVAIALILQVSVLIALFVQTRRTMKQVEDSSGAARSAAKTRLESLAAELTKDAAAAPGITAARIRACVATIQKRSAELK